MSNFEPPQDISTSRNPYKTPQRSGARANRDNDRIPSRCYITYSKRHNTVLGLFSSIPLPAGTLIYAEKPLYRSPISFLTSPNTAAQENALRTHLHNSLLPNQLRQFEKLFCDGEKLWNLATGRETKHSAIVCGSAIPLSTNPAAKGFGEVGVFAHLSRLNHCCAPNCSAVWDDGRGDMRLFALRDLEYNEHLTISYNPAGAIDQKYLKEKYNFLCVCDWCMQSDAIKQVSIANRRTIEDLRGKLVTSIRELNEGSALQLGYEMIRLMYEENVKDFRSGWVLENLMDMMIKVQDLQKAQFFVTHTYLAYVLCDGNEGDLVVNLLEKVGKVWAFSSKADIGKMILEKANNGSGYLGWAGPGQEKDVFGQRALDVMFRRKDWK